MSWSSRLDIPYYKLELGNLIQSKQVNTELFKAHACLKCTFWKTVEYLTMWHNSVIGIVFFHAKARVSSAPRPIQNQAKVPILNLPINVL